MSMRFGRYETIQPLATGGMATVYLGRAVGAGGFERRVAIKVMHDHIADDPDFVAMFLDEARLAARIHHPNVVSTIDVHKGAEGMFLVMEYIEGASLKHILRGMRKRKRRMPFGITVRIMSDALNGLHAAHDLKGKGGQTLNLVHRDVSPHNVLVGTDGVGRITDFGVARAEARLSTTQGGQLKGKIAYMPPEQGLGHDVDRRADVYAAGVVLWEMLTGRRLFVADHDGQLVAMVLQGAQSSPRQACPDVPEPLDAVCMRALALRPDDRFATAGHFAEALEAAAHESGLRVASPRQVAAFVDEFKVEVNRHSMPPAAEDSVSDVHSEPSGKIEVASMPTGTAALSTNDGTSVTRGGNSSARLVVDSRRAGPRLRRGMFAAGMVASIGLALGVGLSLREGEAPSRITSHAGLQAQAAGVAAKELAATEAGRPADDVAAAGAAASQAALVPPPPAASSATEEVSPPPGRLSTPSKSSNTSNQPKQAPKNPLDFDPNDL
jgi:serine/threonine-protein kinase